MKKLIYLLGFLLLLSCSDENLLDSNPELSNEYDYGLLSATREVLNKRALKLIKSGQGEGMTYSQFEKLKSVLIALDDHSRVTSYLIEKLLHGKLGVNWKLNPDMAPEYAAGFNPSSNSIVFRSVDEITVRNILHELFHVYQNKMYRGINTDGDKEGLVNVEFEAHVFESLVFYPNYNPIFNSRFVRVPFKTDKERDRVQQEWRDFLFSIDLVPVIDEGAYNELLNQFGKRYKSLYGDKKCSKLILSNLIISDLIDESIFKQ